MNKIGAGGDDGAGGGHGTTRFEGGLGGHATQDGEWQVEIQPSAIARDPRDPNRNNHIRVVSSISTASATAAPAAAAFDPTALSAESEFPSLASGPPTSGIVITNKWVTFGGSGESASSKQRAKKVADFPPLHSDSVSFKAASAVPKSELSVIANSRAAGGSGKLKGSNSTGSIASTIEQEYLKSNRAFEGTISRSKWLEEGFATAGSHSKSAASASEDDSGLAWAIAESLRTLGKQKSEPDQALSSKEASVAKAEPRPIQVSLDSTQDFPSLSAESNSLAAKPSSVSSKKKSPSSANNSSVSGWSSALNSVGIATVKKDPKLTVIKSLKPPASTKVEKENHGGQSIPHSKSLSQLTDSSTSSALLGGGYSGWVKIGGSSHSDLENSSGARDDHQLPIPPPPLHQDVKLDMSDFPSLSSEKRAPVPAAAVVSLPPSKPKAKKKEKVEDLLRKLETNTLSISKKGKA